MTESMISRLEHGDHVPSLKTLCRIAGAFGRHLEIVFHEHEHVHAEGTRHVHPHSHYDPVALQGHDLVATGSTDDCDGNAGGVAFIHWSTNKSTVTLRIGRMWSRN
jgi:DNA-binding XRE family transcriptional regulator